jgi:heat shock protein HtpX
VSEQEAPDLYRIVRELTQTNQMPMPRIYVSDMMQPNAFATGRNPDHAVVAVTRGILEILDQRELRGVLAHELSHVLNRDTLISTVAATLAGAISYLAHPFMLMGRSRDDREGANPLLAIVAMIAAPIAAMLIQMAVSRSREYGADATGARLVGYPDGLASALRKLQAAAPRIPLQNADPATSHLFIVNPFAGRSLMKLFSTHPPLEERVERLMDMKTQQPW